MWSLRFYSSKASPQELKISERPKRLVKNDPGRITPSYSKGINTALLSQDGYSDDIGQLIRSTSCQHSDTILLNELASRLYKSNMFICARASFSARGSSTSSLTWESRRMLKTSLVLPFHTSSTLRLS